MKNCLCLQFPCKLNNLVEKGMLYIQPMDHGGHKKLMSTVVHVLYVQHIHIIGLFLKSFIFDTKTIKGLVSNVNYSVLLEMQCVLSK